MKLIAIIALLILGVLLWELQTIITFEEIKVCALDILDSIKALIN